MVDLVHSRNSRYLRIRINFLMTKSIFGSVYKWGGEKIIPLESTLTFNVLEKSSSFT